VTNQILFHKPVETINEKWDDTQRDAIKSIHFFEIMAQPFNHLSI